MTASFTTPLISGAGTVTYELGRSVQQLVVEIWASARAQRQAISDAIRRYVGDYLSNLPLRRNGHPRCLASQT